MSDPSQLIMVFNAPIFHCNNNGLIKIVFLYMLKWDIVASDNTFRKITKPPLSIKGVVDLVKNTTCNMAVVHVMLQFLSS